MADPIVTTADLSAHLAGDQQAALDAATAAVRDFCGWHITPVVTETATVTGNGSDVLQLPSLKVASVASVTDENGAEVTGWRLAEAGYLFGRCWTDGHRYSVTLTHGYDEAPAVADVILRAAGAASSAPTAPGPVTSVSLGSARIGYGSRGGRASVGPLSGSDLAVLDRYKLPPLP